MGDSDSTIGSCQYQINLPIPYIWRIFRGKSSTAKKLLYLHTMWKTANVLTGEGSFLSEKLIDKASNTNQKIEIVETVKSNPKTERFIAEIAKKVFTWII